MCSFQVCLFLSSFISGHHFCIDFRTFRTFRRLFLCFLTVYSTVLGDWRKNCYSKSRLRAQDLGIFFSKQHKLASKKRQYVTQWERCGSWHPEETVGRRLPSWVPFATCSLRAGWLAENMFIFSLSASSPSPCQRLCFLLDLSYDVTLILKSFRALRLWNETAIMKGFLLWLLHVKKTKVQWSLSSLPWLTNARKVKYLTYLKGTLKIQSYFVFFRI